MLRKLISLFLCTAGILVLMGAGEEQDQTVQETEATFVEKTFDYISATIGTDMSQAKEVQALVSETAAAVQIPQIPEDADLLLLVDGKPVSLDTNRRVIDGVSYVTLDTMAKELDPSALCLWDPSTNTLTVTTDKLSLSATINKLYMVANGRYLYLPETVQMIDGQVTVPLTTLARAFDAQVLWDSYTGVIGVNTGSGGILSGDAFYNQDDLYWLTRLVYAESGNQPLEGQMAVAMVVYKRIEMSLYPNNIVDVISQTNQFSVWKGGALANRVPGTDSIIATKLVMDGGIVEGLEPAFAFDSLAVSWSSRNLRKIAVIGGHTFYGY